MVKSNRSTLVENDEQRRRRLQAKLRGTTISKSHTMLKRTKSWVEKGKAHPMTHSKHDLAHSITIKAFKSLSAKDMEESIHKASRSQIFRSRNKLKPFVQGRPHSKSAPKKPKKKRTFRFAEPKELENKKLTILHNFS